MRRFADLRKLGLLGLWHCKRAILVHFASLEAHGCFLGYQDYQELLHSSWILAMQLNAKSPSRAFRLHSHFLLCMVVRMHNAFVISFSPEIVKMIVVYIYIIHKTCICFYSHWINCSRYSGSSWFSVNKDARVELS